MDHFGIGHGIQGAARIYFQSGRQTGRTSSLVESLKDGDRVVFTTEREGRRVQALCKERNISIEIIVCDTRIPDRLFHRGPPSGNERTIFDHTWVEQYYKDALARAQDEIDQLQTNLSGRGVPHRETERAAREYLNWR